MSQQHGTRNKNIVYNLSIYWVIFQTKSKEVYVESSLYISVLMYVHTYCKDDPTEIFKMSDEESGTSV